MPQSKSELLRTLAHYSGSHSIRETIAESDGYVVLLLFQFPNLNPSS